MRRPPIILTTDFGYDDEYAGILKGVILSINDNASIVDLTHTIPPQDVGNAALVIGRSYRFFPAGSVHLCVVDPGVGTKRKILAIKACNQYFVGPDNGVSSQILTTEDSIEIHKVTNESWFLDEVSNTFHGRDIMAPVAARISLGEPIDAAGPSIQKHCCVTIPVSMPIYIGSEVIGEVSSIDGFGNIITNISKACLKALPGSAAFILTIRSSAINYYEGSYADLPDNQLAAIINSSNSIEICVKNSSAAEVLGVRVGEQVFIN